MWSLIRNQKQSIFWRLSVLQMTTDMFYFPALSAFMTYHRVCWFILYPYQAIDRLSKGSLSKDVESMRTKMFDKCIRNEMEEDMRKELTKIREECMELRQDIHNINTRHIPPNILSKLCCLLNLIKNYM